LYLGDYPDLKNYSLGLAIKTAPLLPQTNVYLSDIVCPITKEEKMHLKYKVSFNQIQMVFLLSLFISLSNIFSIAIAADDTAKEKLKNILSQNSFQQSLQWEQQCNLKPFCRPTKDYSMALVEYPKDETYCYVSKDIPKSLEQLIKTFIQKDKVFFPLHPFTQSSDIPWYEKHLENKGKSRLDPTIKLKSLPVKLTASRTLYHSVDAQTALGIKTGTDYILDKNDHNFQKVFHHQPNKLDLSEEVMVSKDRDEYLKSVNDKVGPDSDLIFLKEVASAQVKDWKDIFFSHKHFGNGFILRDITPLTDGNYYVPAFSIPYIGHNIAQINGEDFNQFWGKHFAKNLGRIKAKLLLRYGLQMETPNTQNMLIQLDAKTLKPTGKMVLRDMSDTQFVSPVAKALDPSNEEQWIEKDLQHKVKNISPFWYNSSWRLDSPISDSAISKTVINQWEEEHSKGYLEEINSALNINIKPLDLTALKTQKKELYSFLESVFDDNQHRFPLSTEHLYTIQIQKFLTSKEGQEKLREYRMKLEKSFQAK
ncbi:MAG: hypothetical protein HQK51_10070, partial [Oligoflexia bacterium]|nr:hypothetical protein [Oligoflexia bacterium]